MVVVGVRGPAKSGQVLGWVMSLMARFVGRDRDLVVEAIPAPGPWTRRMTPMARLRRAAIISGPLRVSSPGFCGGWFIWFRWLPVVIVPGGGCRAPRRLRARRGFASDGGVWPGGVEPVDPLGGGDHGRRRCPPKGPGYGSARPCTAS